MSCATEALIEVYRVREPVAWEVARRAGEAVDAKGASSGDGRVSRGARCLCASLRCRAAGRCGSAPGWRGIRMGARHVRAPVAAKGSERQGR